MLKWGTERSPGKREIDFMRDWRQVRLGTGGIRQGQVEVENIGRNNWNWGEGISGTKWKPSATETPWDLQEQPQQTPSDGGHGACTDIFFSQASPLVEGLVDQCSHKIFDLQFLLPTENSGTRSQYNYHQRDKRDFIPQLMGADRVPQPKTLGGGLEILLRMGRKGQKNQRSQGHHKNTAWDSMGLTKIRETVGV